MNGSSISASIIIYCESDTCSIGQTLVLHGKIKLFNRARNEGNFDQAAYYKVRGTAFAVSDVDEVSAYGKANLIAGENVSMEISSGRVV